MRYVTIGFIFHNKKLLVIYHKKLKTWLPVGGHLEGNETFEESLLREIKEEVNLGVTILNPYPSHDGVITQHIPFYIHCGEENGIRKTWMQYICIAKDIESLKIQTNELKDYKWIEKEELGELETFPLVKTLALSAFDAI